MRVIIFGANGLLGGYLKIAFADTKLFAWDRDDLDITDVALVREQCEAASPDIIVNAAAYNAVDEAEQNPTASRQAFRINAHAVRGLADTAKALGAVLVHFSTDYVFDGTRRTPYPEDAPTHPLSAYGRSKLEGERYVTQLGETGLCYYVVRTSRLFGKVGSAGAKVTFPDLMLRLADERGRLTLVDGSEVASPTFAADLAAAVKQLVTEGHPFGTYHRTNDGAVTWFAFAKGVLEMSGKYTLEEEDVAGKKFVELTPVPAADLPRPAKRPAYSVLGTTKLPSLRPWQDAVREYLTSVKGASHDTL